MKYFVSFQGFNQQGVLSFGNLECHQPLVTMQNIRDLEAIILERHPELRSVTVMSWQPFDQPCD